MPEAKVTWFFESGLYGWSESLWKSYNANLSELYTPATNYALVRLPLCGEGVSMPYIRISDDTVYRDSLVLAPNYLVGSSGTQEAGTTGGNASNPSAVKGALANSPPDQPYSAIQVRMESGPNYRRQMYLRGVPDAVIVNPPGPVLPGAWGVAYAAWQANLIANWSFKVKSKAGTFNPVAVTNFAAGTPPIITAPGTAVANGDLVQLVGFKGYKDVRYTGYVTGLVGNTFKLVGQISLSDINQVKGYAQKIAYIYTGITQVIIRNETHRNTGRPFGSPRGRQKARA